MNVPQLTTPEEVQHESATCETTIASMQLTYYQEEMPEPCQNWVVNSLQCTIQQLVATAGIE